MLNDFFNEKLKITLDSKTSYKIQIIIKSIIRDNREYTIKDYINIMHIQITKRIKIHI